MKAIMTLDVVMATRQDFLIGIKPEYGRIFFLKKKDWKYFHGPYSLNKEHVYSGQLSDWLEHDMVYVKTPSDFPEINIEKE